MRPKRGGKRPAVRPPGAPANASRVRLRQGVRHGGTAAAAQTNAELVQLGMAQARAATDNDVWPSDATNATDGRARLAKLTERDNSMKSYMKELRKVLEHADVLLEVLDVRDPLGCRYVAGAAKLTASAYAIEQEALRQGKQVVLVLNKIDLVPASNTRAWLAFLRQDFPTLPFKASTQQQRSHLAQGPSIVWKKGPSGQDAQLAGGAEAAGTKAILQLIKNYSRNMKLKTSITVGTIGAPNVGKSSLINSMKRARVCGVAATPGHTKVVQGIMLDRHVRLLDSPGIVFTDSNAPPGATPAEATAAAEAAMLRNVLKVELVGDPVEPVQAILNRINPQHLADVYGIPAMPWGSAQDFLLRVAYQKGRLARGGIPDLDGTARSVLHDWNTGKIRYHSEPPAKLHHIHRRSAPAVPGAPPANAGDAVLSSLGESFDLAALLGAADAAALGGDGAYSPPPAASDAAEAGASDSCEDDADVTESTLGKRSRAASTPPSDSDSDERDTATRRRGNAFATLADTDHDEEDDEHPEGRAVQPAHRAPAPAARPRALFSAAEAEGMATARGAARRKARKWKKRQAAGALVGVLDTLMDLGGSEGAEEGDGGAEEESEGGIPDGLKDTDKDEGRGAAADTGAATAPSQPKEDEEEEEL
ncbi:nuclear GTP-binding protein nug1 [Malassezia sp. CBS 17886]|nr:nuclear GTP-binding protein nug1 [Malassezia sp. CBS 17886]